MFILDVYQYQCDISVPLGWQHSPVLISFIISFQKLYLVWPNWCAVASTRGQSIDVMAEYKFLELDRHCQTTSHPTFGLFVSGHPSVLKPLNSASYLEARTIQPFPSYFLFLISADEW